MMRFTVNEVRIIPSFNTFSWIRKSLTPNVRSIWTNAVSPTATENTPISLGVSRRLTITTVRTLKTRLEYFRANDRTSARLTLCLFLDMRRRHVWADLGNEAIQDGQLRIKRLKPSVPWNHACASTPWPARRVRLSRGRVFLFIRQELQEINRHTMRPVGSSNDLIQQASERYRAIAPRITLYDAFIRDRRPPITQGADEFN